MCGIFPANVKSLVMFAVIAVDTLHCGLPVCQSADGVTGGGGSGLLISASATHIPFHSNRVMFQGEFRGFTCFLIFQVRLNILMMNCF